MARIPDTTDKTFASLSVAKEQFVPHFREKIATYQL